MVRSLYESLCNMESIYADRVRSATLTKYPPR